MLSYRKYRLDDATQRRSSRTTGKVHDFLKRMELTLKDHRFSGEDPIRVLDFLARYVKEANIQAMSEAQAFIALPSFLIGFAKSQYEAGVQLTSPDEGGVTSWPEAVQYLLRNYAHSTYIPSAISDLRSVRQSHSETENSFAKLINDAIARCGNVHSAEEVVTLFIDGL